VRVLPLVDHRQPAGALVLLRDVSDVRRRDRLLLSKDATIREIHHRVKNNLQTIASLLRLQGRRLTSPEARAALAESERRIRSIAIVHETLSREAGDVVSLNEIVRPLARLVEDTASTPDHTIRFKVEGDAGDLPGEVATPLAVVLNELMQNAVDHAFPEQRSEASVEVTLARTDGHVEIEVRDNGTGLPREFTLEGSRGLGLSIVQALVTSELQGSIEMRDDNGTSVRVRVPVEVRRVEL
jgi:two-component sensor histidine kinase